MAITMVQGTPADEATTGVLRFILSDSAIVSPGLSPLTTWILTNASLQAAAASKGPIVIRRVARVMDDGLSQAGIAAGSITQAQARALFCLNDSGGATLSSSQVPRVRTIITSGARGGNPVAGRVWGVDASVDGAGRPTLLITARSARVCVKSASNESGVAVAYLDLVCSTAQGA